MKHHTFNITTTWTGANGVGTTEYSAYSRDYDMQAPGKPVLHCSTDPAFRGDGSKYNPEDMLVGALSSCHMLWYFHLCADAGIVVLEYVDKAVGTMTSGPDGGRFTGVVLRPEIRVQSPEMIEKAVLLHETAHKKCFIASSVNFPVGCEPHVVA